MIYTRHGMKVRIAADCGEQKPHTFQFPAELLKLEELNDEGEPIGKFLFYFLPFLKAEGGWDEIQNVLKYAPEIKLDKKELKQAIKQAM